MARVLDTITAPVRVPFMGPRDGSMSVGYDDAGHVVFVLEAGGQTIRLPVAPDVAARFANATHRAHQLAVSTAHENRIPVPGRGARVDPHPSNRGV